MAVAVLVVLLLAGERFARAVAPLPADRVWPDVEAQVKADHAQEVGARDGREEVIFTGSSISDAAFAPDVVAGGVPGDLSMYNYAQEGSAAATSAEFVRVAVLDQVDPDLVIMGLTSNELNDGGTTQRELEELQRNSRGFRVAAGTPTVADRINEWFTTRSDLLAHRPVLRDPYRLFREHGTTAKAPWNDPDTGALLRHRENSYEAPVTDDPEAAARLEAVYGNFAVGGHQLSAVRDLAAAVRDRGGSLVVVELPVFLPGFLATIDDGAALLEKTHDALVELEQEACVERLDLRSMLQEERYWSDPVHVNGAGTQAISTAVGAWLAERGLDRTRC